MESEVTDRVTALHRRSKPLSAVLPRKIRRYAVADQPLFAAPQPLSPSFSRPAGALAVVSELSLGPSVVASRGSPLSRGVSPSGIPRSGLLVRRFRRRLGGAHLSVTFAEMECLEGLFWCQLEATSSSLWMMSGILAMLKRDGFNPSTPGLFNTAISSVSASLAFQARMTA